MRRSCEILARKVFLCSSKSLSACAISLNESAKSAISSCPRTVTRALKSPKAKRLAALLISRSGRIIPLLISIQPAKPKSQTTTADKAIACTSLPIIILSALERL